MLSDREAKRRGLPKGSLFMAAETMRNLQQVAMGLVTVCLSKEAEGNFWSSGNHRLSELSVEQHFGRLRVQSPSAQLTSRSYWAAAARDMLRTKSKKQADTPLPVGTVKPLTADEFYYESEKAVRSAVRLAAWCQDCTQQSLHDMYLEWCGQGGFEDIGTGWSGMEHVDE